MKNLFSKSLMVAAAALTLVSCSNEEEVPVNPYEGKTSDVTVVMSIVGAGSKSSAADVNMDGNVQDINNAVIVPMVGNAYQTPIVFETISNGSDKKVKTLPQTVNRFKVYGNATTSNAKETTVFKSTDLTFTVGTSQQIDGKDFYAPHGLYYYRDTQNEGYRATTNDNWENVTWTDVTPDSDPIGTRNCVKIDGVKYAVGVLAAAVKNGDTTTEFYDTDPSTGSPLGSTWQEGDIEISGILIYDQAKSFDDSFTASGDEVNVYEKVANGKAAINDQNAVNENFRGTGNIYCVVAPTAKTVNTVSLNIEFIAKKYFKLADGTVVAPNDKIYLPVVLDKLAIGAGAEKQIFEAAVATFLNATVKNWGLASKTPIESTDVTIGVEFDASWAAGLNFDLDI